MKFNLISSLVLSLILVACNNNARLSDRDGTSKKVTSPINATDGGSTDGGSTDGGSTDGGSTDGGSTDGGSTDGGSADGGSADGGSTDGGSTGDPAPDKSIDVSEIFSRDAVKSLKEEITKNRDYPRSLDRLVTEEMMSAKVNEKLKAAGSDIEDIYISEYAHGKFKVSHFTLKGSETPLFVTSEMYRDCVKLNKKNIFDHTCDVEEMIDYLNCNLKEEYREATETQKTRVMKKLAVGEAYKVRKLTEYVNSIIHSRSYSKSIDKGNSSSYEAKMASKVDQLASDLGANWKNTEITPELGENAQYTCMTISSEVAGESVSKEFDVNPQAQAVEYIVNGMLK